MGATLKADGALLIGERAAAATDEAAYGQIWVKNLTPPELWYTDDIGGDFNLSNPIKTACKTIDDISTTDDGLLFFQAEDDLTILTGWATCAGTCTTEADFTFDIQRTGSGNTYAVTGTVDSEDIVTGDTKTTFSGNTDVGPLDLIRHHTSNTPSPSGSDDYIICVGFTKGAT
jgi:hypothetical protein